MRIRTVMMPALALAIALGATSCGDDDAGAPEGSTTIAGPPSYRFHDAEWVITKVIAADVAHPAPYDNLNIKFLDADAIRAYLGCNTASGTYTADQSQDGKSGSFSITELRQTEMACTDREEWALLSEALIEATRWSFDDGSLLLEGPRLTVAAYAAGYLGPPERSVDPDEPVTSPIPVEPDGGIGSGAGPISTTLRPVTD